MADGKQELRSKIVLSKVKSDGTVITNDKLDGQKEHDRIMSAYEKLFKVILKQ